MHTLLSAADLLLQSSLCVCMHEHVCRYASVYVCVKEHVCGYTCVSVCVHENICECMSVHAHTHAKVKSHIFSSLYFETECLTDLGLPSWQRWLSGELQESTFLCLPRMGITGRETKQGVLLLGHLFWCI